MPYCKKRDKEVAGLSRCCWAHPSSQEGKIWTKEINIQITITDSVLE
jgi:hypothetical protein